MSTTINLKTRLYAPLPAAFLARGARTVLATGWKLADDYAATFVPALVAHYWRNTARDVAVAYATAQRDAIAQGKAPYHWATWMLFGDPARQSTHARGETPAEQPRRTP